MFKVFATLWRASAAEAEESLFDANAIRLLRQHLREATAAFELAKHELAGVMAQEAAETRRAADLTDRIGSIETEARQALANGEEARAEALAVQIGLLTDEARAHADTAASCGREVRRIREQIDEAARRIAEVKRGLSTAAATDALQRTRGRLGDSGPAGPGSLREAEATLKRIRERQQNQDDVASARDMLEQSMTVGGAAPSSAARPRTNPKDILARLKAGPASPASR